MRVDTHIHLIPPELEKQTGVFSRTPEQLLERCRQNGAERLVIQGWPFGALADCKVQNRASLEAVAQYPMQFMAFCTVPPEAGEAALQEVCWCLDHGCSGVGELDPVRQRFTLTHPVFEKLCRICMERGCVLCLSAPMTVGNTLAQGPMPAEYLRLIEAHPDLLLLLTSYGGGLPFYALMPEVAAKLRNVWFDTAPDGVPLLPQAAECTKLCLGENRLLYGSHLPGPVHAAEPCWELPEEWEDLWGIG